jgi:amidase
MGVSPMFDSMSTGSMFTADAGRHGGNLDVSEVRRGVTVHLPVFVKGALLGVGDLHAYLPPTGELTAVDAAGTVTITVDLVKGKAVNWPRIESEEYLMTVNTKSPMEKAVYTGISEMILWLGEYGLEPWDAWERITEVGESKISKVSSGLHPVITTKFPRKYIKT